MPGIKNFFTTKPFFWLLIPLFFLLKNANIYFGFVPAAQIFLLLGEYLAFALVLYLVVYRISGKKGYKAALYCLVLLSVYFFYSPCDEFIQAQEWLRPFNRYKFFLPFFGLLLSGILFAIHRLKRPPARSILFFNLLLSIFLFLELLRLAGNLVNPPKPLLSVENKPLVLTRTQHARPNIYFLLFDEYMGNDGLQTRFHFDNDRLTRALKGNGFFVPRMSRSNYNFTFFSMPSIFNMDYLKGEVQGRNYPETLLRFSSGIKLIKNAKIFGFLKDDGYRIVDLSPFALDSSGERISAYGTITAYGKDLIATQTIFYDLAEKFAWQIDKKGWLDLTNPLDYYNRYYNKYVEEHLIGETAAAAASATTAATGANATTAASDTGRPKFTYAHFFLPHFPFYKDSSGRDISLKYQLQDMPDSARIGLYLGFIKYTNTVLIPMIATMIRNDPQAIIIVMSDHGLRDESPAEYSNQFAIRIPGDDYGNWPDTVDAVNVFRTLLNDCFGQKLNYLPYRQIAFTLKPKSGTR